MDSVVSRDAQIQLSEYMLEFVRASIFDNTPKISGDVSIDWDELMDLSAEQGLLAWVWDGICKLPQEQQPSRIQRINWGLSVQELLSNNHHQKKVLQDIVDKCNKHGIKVLLLKGLSLAELYPKPEFRPSADIDLYFFDDCLRAATILSDGNYLLDGKHYVFEIEGVQVECHERLIDTGTETQKKAHDYLLTRLNDVALQKEGYCVLSYQGVLIHTLMHNIAHFYNPGPDPLRIRSLLDYAMLIKELREWGNVDEYLRIVKSLQIKEFSDLSVNMSEWIMRMDFSNLYLCKSKILNDVEKFKLLLLDNELRHPSFDNYSFIKQLVQRIKYNHITAWKNRYVPEIRRIRFNGKIRYQVHLFIKSLFNFPFDVPFMDSFRGKCNH